MAFEIKNPPVFTTDVPQWTKQTRANGEEMAKVIEKLLNNEVFLKYRMGRVLIGAEDTELEEQDTLFVVDASELPRKFEAAAFKNLVFGAAAPGDSRPAFLPPPGPRRCRSRRLVRCRLWRRGSRS